MDTTTRSQIATHAESDPFDHLNYIVQVVRDIDADDPQHEVVATFASEADALIIAQRWARNEAYDLAGIYDLETGEVTIVHADGSVS